MTYSPALVSNRKSNTYFLIAFGLLNTLAFTLLLCGLSLLAGLTISKWQFPVACVLALIATNYTARFLWVESAKRSFLNIGGAIVGLVIASILFCGSFYDVSYDGQWYHQETVYRLKQGYNPVYQQVPVPPDEVLGSYKPEWCTGIDKRITNVVKTDKLPVNLKFLNINSFGKGTEMIQAAIYQLSNRIETAKAVNGIMLIASFFLCLSLLYKINRISTRKKWVLAVLLSFNPVAITQLLSFCVDGNVACLLLCLLAISCLLFIEINRCYLILFAAIIIIAVNIKFTSLVFAAMYCTGFLIVLLIYRKMDAFKKVLIAGVLSAAIGILCCGFNPYITNIIQKHNMFYGLDETRVEIQRMTPPLFQNLNRFEKLFLSLSAHQGWHSADKSAIREIPKIPFTFNKEDIHDANDGQQEFSGFGPFFSGALLIAIVLFMVALIRSRKTPVFKHAVAAILIILSTVLIMPDSWWMRFVPQLWLLPVIILIMAEFISIRGGRLLKGILYLSLSLNVAWALLSIVFNIFSTARINYQMQQLKALNQPVNIEYCSFESYKSNRVRFLEWGISTTEKNVTGPNVYNVEASNTRFETPVPLPELPGSFVLRLSERVKAGK
jgi:hypothetical protein